VPRPKRNLDFHASGTSGIGYREQERERKRERERETKKLLGGLLS
jgi:hypothetical protein